MTTLQKLTRQPIANVFVPRAFVKRRSASTGLYESTWQEITEFIKGWGGLKSSIDDLKLNRFTQTGVTLKGRNDEGKFNPESSANSLWNGFLTRYRTLVKIEGGYLNTNGSDFTEFPTDTSLGIFIMSDEIPIRASTKGRGNDATIKCKSLVSVFDEVRATDIVGLGSTQTASELVTRIRDHTDGSGNLIFRQFISLSSWTIQTTTNNYNFATSTSLDRLTAWEMMVKLAEAEGHILLINRLGGIEFRNRNERTSTSQFTFYGQSFARPNIISLDNYVEALNKHFNFFRLKFEEGDTTTSYVTAGTITTVDPSNTSWIYGSKVYNFDNTFITNTTTAQTIVNNLFAEFEPVKEEIDLTANFTPQLEISDKVLLNYKSYDLANATLWDQFNWDEASWDAEAGENFEWIDQPFKILSIQHDLNKYITKFKLREI